ncbi:MAG: hypothetical protein M0031_13140 [Thermaerobacter sp.]|nr:hypothetical protein [Thermaerobacter sp.]
MATVDTTYEYLDKMQDRVVRFVVDHSRIAEERYRERAEFRTGQPPTAKAVGMRDQGPECPADQTRRGRHASR